jgi:hypothetical protein
MRSRTRVATVAAAVLLALVAFGDRLTALTPTEIWGQQTPLPQLSQADGQALPGELTPAFRFQVLYGKILTSAKAPEWRSELARFADSRDTDPVSAGIREVARIWIARAEMEDIDSLLVDYYSRNIRFPKTDADFQKLLPAPLAKDPWGQPWVYSPAIPHGFSAVMMGQRYQLSPTGMPGLLSLKDAVKERQPLKITSTVTPKEIAGHHALEFRSPQSVSVIEPGGKAENCLLLYVGDHWALLSENDRIFSIPF